MTIKWAHQMSSMLFILLYIIIYLGCICIHCGSILPTDRSFRIEAEVYKSRPQSEDLVVFESYSMVEKRAKLIITNGSIKEPMVEYHYDPTIPNSGVIYSRQTKECNLFSLSDLYNRYFKSTFKILMEFPLAKSPLNKYVVGLSKLLLLVSSRASDLELQESSVSIMGIDLVQYRLDIKINEDSTTSLYVNYDRASHKPESIENEIPKLIDCDGISIYYDFLGFNDLDYYDSYGVESETSVVMSPFELPSSIKCLQLLPKYNLLPQFDMQSFKFSFEAEITMPLQPINNQQLYWVQYDGLLRTIRVDDRNLKTGEIKSNLIDLRSDRRYLIWGKQSQMKRRCVVLENLGRLRSQLNEPKLSISIQKLILGQADLTLLGRGLFGGIDTLVYAGLSEILPYWLDLPLLYGQIKSPGEEKLRRRGDPIIGDTESNKFKYKILTYVDLSIESKLMAIDVFDLNKSSEKIISVRIHNFRWKLSDAPDGTKQSELFTPVESCSGISRESHYADIDLLLEQDEPSTIANSSNDNNWILDKPSRECALIAGIADSFNLESSMMVDMESQIRTGKQLVLNVDFKLIERPKLVHRIEYIGAARLDTSGNYQSGDEADVGGPGAGAGIRTKNEALTLADCLSYLINDNDDLSVNPLYVYYSEFHLSCIIDPKLNGNREFIDGSSFFQLVDPKEASGELYKITAHIDEILSAGSSLIRDEKFSQLENRVVLLTYARGEPVMPIDPAIYRMRVKQAKLRNFNYYLGQESHHMSKKDSYANLALIEDEGANRLVKPLDNEAGEDENIKLSECQAACLADLRCRSFSYCAHYQDSECILSEIPFESIELRKQIQEFAQSSTGISSTGVMAKKQTFQVQTIDSYDIMNNNTTRQVTLRKDTRCELFQKPYLDLFNRGDGLEKNVLYKHWIIPVAGVEDCAESCFTKTLGKLKMIEQSLHHDISSRVKLDTHLRDICPRFLYLDTKLLTDDQQKALMETIGDSRFNLSTHTGGFCLIKDDALPCDHPAAAQMNVFFNFNYYEFKFITLFEKIPSIQLIETVSQEEKSSFERYSARKATDEDLASLKEANKEGRNLQDTLVVPEDYCAQKCFLQSSGLWPACKSFDIVRVFSPEAKSTHSLCTFNSMSISDNKNLARHSDDQKAANSLVWHYEFRWDLIKRAIEADLYASEPTSANENKHKTSNNGLFGTGLIIMLLIIFAKLSGFVLGMNLTERYYQLRIDRTRHLSVTNPIIAIPMINTSNISEEPEVY